MSLRYFNAAGASADGRIGEDWDFSINLIPLAMKAVLLDGHRLQVFGADYDTPDGTCIRDYIHVDDLADAHVKALDYLAAGGATGSVNVGTGVGSSVFDVIRATEAAAGRAVPHDVVARRAGDPVSTFADPTRAARAARLDARNSASTTSCDPPTPGTPAGADRRHRAPSSSPAVGPGVLCQQQRTNSSLLLTQTGGGCSACCRYSPPGW